MLVNCPECNLQVSDKAVMCPHCGYPLRPNELKKISKRPNRRKRLPNGFGQISEIKGRGLRKPFRAMVTVGKNEFGRPICRLLQPEAYFETYNDAYAALLKYNSNSYAINDLTMEDLYERWSAKRFPESSESARNIYRSAWSYAGSIYKEKVLNVRMRHIRACVEGAEKNGKEASPSMKAYVKMVLNLMFDYAVEYELTDRNYARELKLGNGISKEAEESRTEHISFEEVEIEALWKNIKHPYVDMILIQCYSGWRPQELASLKLENINLENRTMKGGMKTDAGSDRIVPIHSKIYPLVERKYKESKRLNSSYLFNRKNKPFTYAAYRFEFNKIVEELDLNPHHKPHDPRKFFVSACKKYNVDEYAIKYMVGHTITDITERVYTKRDLDWLKKELEKLK